MRSLAPWTFSKAHPGWGIKSSPVTHSRVYKISGRLYHRSIFCNCFICHILPVKMWRSFEDMKMESEDVSDFCITILGKTSEYLTLINLRSNLVVKDCKWKLYL